MTDRQLFEISEEFVNAWCDTHHDTPPAKMSEGSLWHQLLAVEKAEPDLMARFKALDIETGRKLIQHTRTVVRLMAATSDRFQEDAA